MNPGAIDEAGRTARSLVTALREQPITLALVVFNVIFLLVVYFGINNQRKYLEAFQTKMFEQQSETMKLLYNCTPTNR